MTSRAKTLLFEAPAVACLLSPAGARAQFMPAGSGTNLTSVMYYDPPFERQVKVRLSGAEMSPLPGMARYDVKLLRIEKFSTSGALEAVVTAPQCNYSPLDETASSTGHLDLVLGNGKIHAQGEGFLFLGQQNRQLLVISNRQQTIIKANWKLPNL